MVKFDNKQRGVRISCFNIKYFNYEYANLTPIYAVKLITSKEMINFN